MISFASAAGVFTRALRHVIIVLLRPASLQGIQPIYAGSIICGSYRLWWRGLRMTIAHGILNWRRSHQTRVRSDYLQLCDRNANNNYLQTCNLDCQPTREKAPYSLPSHSHTVYSKSFHCKRQSCISDRADVWCMGPQFTLKVSQIKH